MGPVVGAALDIAGVSCAKPAILAFAAGVGSPITAVGLFVNWRVGKITENHFENQHKDQKHGKTA